MVPVVPPLIVALIVLIDCLRLFLLWRRNKQFEFIGAIIARVCCFVGIYVYYAFVGEGGTDKAVMRWMVTTYFLCSILMGMFTFKGKRYD
jgi:hypothetical protein